MLRPVLFLHRWLGVVVGLLMTIWCLSGFVMMYVDYPRLVPAEQLQGLAPLQLLAADKLDTVDLPPDTLLSTARLEMMAGRPVLRVMPAMDPSRPIAQMRVIPGAFDLSSGKALPPLKQSDLKAIGTAFGTGRGIDGAPALVVETPIDQWTVQAYRRNAPLYRVDYDDPAGSQVYISGQSGEVVQDTTRTERFWNWLGAVPHWLYPTMLRQDGELWSEVVIWTSLVGCFLTVTGLWVGIARLRRTRDGSVGSPYRGVWWWHHVFGLFFGILTLTWVASGLFSMNPWGFLGSMAGFAEREQLAGEMRWEDLRKAMASAPAVDGVVRLEAAPLDGRVHILATKRDGNAVRYGPDGHPSRLTEQELRAAVEWNLPLASLELLKTEDSYYYSHKFPAPLPVWRAVLNDAEQTRLYIDPISGKIVRAFDSSGRSFRWLQDGLHSLDFPVLRRPLWDFVVVPLLAMVTLVCATGTWMAWSKVKRDLRRIRLRYRMKNQPISQGEQA